MIVTTATDLRTCAYCHGPNDTERGDYLTGADGLPTCNGCYCPECGCGHAAPEGADECAHSAAAFDHDPNGDAARGIDPDTLHDQREDRL